MNTEPRQRLSLEAAAADWDRDQVAAKVQRAAEQREEFVHRFPASVWPELPLDRYALGLPGSDENFSWWLEFGTPVTGSIKGGSAHKHLVYKRQNQPGWYYPKKYSSEIEAWEAVRQGFAELVRLVATEAWDEVDQIESLFEAPAVRTKTAWMYFPDRLLPIYSFRHVDFFIRIFGVEVESDGSIRRNRALFEALTSLEIFDGWSPIEIMYFLYDWADPNPSHAILKIAPDQDGHLWDDCRTNGYIRVGWDQLGDLSLLQDVDEIRQALVDQEGMAHSSALTKTARGLDQLRSLNDGDIIVANRGTKAVLGIGRVSGGYQYRPDLPDHRQTVLVDWFDTAERQVDFGAAWRPTIVKVKPEQYHQIVHDSGRPVLIDSVPPPAIPEMHREAERLLERTKQIILYGPPGTGKTYSARRHAVWLLSGGSADPDAARAFGTADEFAKLEARHTDTTAPDKRPAWLVVANPGHWKWSNLIEQGVVSYSYGKLPENYRDVRPGDLVYGYEASPTKAIVAKARINHGLHTNPEGEQKILIADGSLVENGPTWAQLQSDMVLSGSQPVRHGMQGTLFRLEPNEVWRLEGLLEESGNKVPTGSSGTRGTARLTRVTFHPTYTYEDFIEGYKPVESGVGGLELRMRDGLFKRLCRAASDDLDNPYVLLIDEINRGNVPKIFGELITLLEADKRGITVTLPQSGDSFMVPPNVYVIATMNTADRSIHVLDAALRRRFAFVELLPEPTLLEGSSVGNLPLDELLRELNGLVREHIGREKQIGHAVFMNGDRPISSAEEFALAFRYEVLPLLQEYTYGDYADLAVLLGDEIIDNADQVPRSDVLDDPEQLLSALATHLSITTA